MPRRVSSCRLAPTVMIRFVSEKSAAYAADRNTEITYGVYIQCGRGALTGMLTGIHGASLPSRSFHCPSARSKDITKGTGTLPTPSISEHLCEIVSILLTSPKDAPSTPRPPSCLGFTTRTPLRSSNAGTHSRHQGKERVMVHLASSLRYLCLAFPLVSKLFFPFFYIQHQSSSVIITFVYFRISLFFSLHSPAGQFKHSALVAFTASNPPSLT